MDSLTLILTLIPTLTHRAELKRLKVAPLKEQLEARGLSTDGKKEELFARLQEAAAPETGPSVQQYEDVLDIAYKMRDEIVQKSQRPTKTLLLLPGGRTALASEAVSALQSSAGLRSPPGSSYPLVVRQQTRADEPTGGMDLMAELPEDRASMDVQPSSEWHLTAGNGFASGRDAALALGRSMRVSSHPTGTLLHHTPPKQKKEEMDEPEATGGGSGGGDGGGSTDDGGRESGSGDSSIAGSVDGNGDADLETCVEACDGSEEPYERFHDSFSKGMFVFSPDCGPPLLDAEVPIVVKTLQAHFVQSSLGRPIISGDGWSIVEEIGAQDAQEGELEWMQQGRMLCRRLTAFRAFLAARGKKLVTPPLLGLYYHFAGTSVHSDAPIYGKALANEIFRWVLTLPAEPDGAHCTEYRMRKDAFENGTEVPNSERATIALGVGSYGMLRRPSGMRRANCGGPTSVRCDCPRCRVNAHQRLSGCCALTLQLDVELPIGLENDDEELCIWMASLAMDVIEFKLLWDLPLVESNRSGFQLPVVDTVGTLGGLKRLLNAPAPKVAALECCNLSYSPAEKRYINQRRGREGVHRLREQSVHVAWHMYYPTELAFRLARWLLAAGELELAAELFGEVPAVHPKAADEGGDAVMAEADEMEDVSSPEAEAGLVSISTAVRLLPQLRSAMDSADGGSAELERVEAHVREESELLTKLLGPGRPQAQSLMNSLGIIKEKDLRRAEREETGEAPTIPQRCHNVRLSTLHELGRKVARPTGFAMVALASLGEDVPVEEQTQIAMARVDRSKWNQRDSLQGHDANRIVYLPWPPPTSESDYPIKLPKQAPLLNIFSYRPIDPSLLAHC